MEATERRKLMRAIGQLLDSSEELLEPGSKVKKLEGDGWRAWLYQPAPGNNQVHVEFRVGDLLEAAA